MKLLLTTIAAILLLGCGKASNPEVNSALMDAAMYGNIETANKAFADGADVNLKDERGFTPLHFSAWYGHKEVVELLITKGVQNVNAKVLSGAKKGYTPLDLTFLNLEMSKLGGESSGRKYKETADLLRKHGGKTGEELKAEGK